MTVTKRIKAIESLVPYGTRLLDVGSDHALLPISLCLSGRIAEAVISDINEGPLDSGRRNVALLCPALKASFVLSDGFANVKHGSYDTVAICGMGGELIARIINDGGEKARVPLILQPMTHAEDLRKYLWENGFEISKELYVSEGRRVYCVLLVRYTGKNTDYEYCELYLGKEHPPTADYARYAEKILNAAEKRLQGCLHSDDRLGALAAEKIVAEAKSYITTH